MMDGFSDNIYERKNKMLDSDVAVLETFRNEEGEWEPVAWVGPDRTIDGSLVQGIDLVGVDGVRIRYLGSRKEKGQNERIL
jgi:hypothetical protein